MDGTLIDTLSDIADSVNFVLNKYNFPQHSYAKYKIFIGDGIENLVTRALPKTINVNREKILNEIVKENKLIIGGSADLAGSNNTKTKNHRPIKKNDFKGNYIHYGVREHAMAGIMNGLALHSNIIPYGGTFLIFSDYCKPSIRLSALMGLRVIYVMTHDSIGLGEDGPTHQPVEQLSGLRSIPNLNILRPADTIETIECWQIALENKTTPSILTLTRQKVDPIRKKHSSDNKCSYGAYEVVRSSKDVDCTIFASGSEVSLAIKVCHKLATEKIYSKVISVPCQELFDKQNNKYKKKILEETENKISIEAGTTDCWTKYIGRNGIAFGVNNFGKSAPYKDIFKDFKLTLEDIVNSTKKMINKN